MVSLWGSKKDDDPQAQQNGHEEVDSTLNGTSENMPRDSSEQQADERTRLLPQQRLPPPHADGYLDPDDPAVS